MHTERWGTAHLPERRREEEPRRAAEPRRMLVEIVGRYIRHGRQAPPAHREAPHLDLSGSPRPWPRPARRAKKTSTIELIQRLERLERTRNQ